MLCGRIMLKCAVQLLSRRHKLSHLRPQITAHGGLTVSTRRCCTTISTRTSGLDAKVSLRKSKLNIHLSSLFHLGGKKSPQTSIKNKQIQNHLLSSKLAPLIPQPRYWLTVLKWNTRLHFPSVSAQTLGAFLLVLACLLSHVVACDSRGFAT